MTRSPSHGLAGSCVRPLWPLLLQACSAWGEGLMALFCWGLPFQKQLLQTCFSRPPLAMYPVHPILRGVNR